MSHPAPHECTSREFAVLIPLLDRSGHECVLLTKRPDTLKRYPGQVSLPGGAREPADQSLWETALRETCEEVGIPPEAVEALDELDWFQTTLGDRIKPYVGRVRGCQPVVATPDEVECLLYLPTSRIEHDLFRRDSRWTDHDGKQHEIYEFDLDGHRVWGLTARILYAAFVE